MFDRNELILESLTEIPDAPAQTMERPSHYPRELPRSVKSQVPLPRTVTQSRRLHSPFSFRNFVFRHEAPGSADWEKINNITLARASPKRGNGLLVVNRWVARGLSF